MMRGTLQPGTAEIVSTRTVDKGAFSSASGLTGAEAGDLSCNNDAAKSLFKDEKAFMAFVVRMAKERGWMAYHTLDSRGGEEGFPDIILLRGGVMLTPELKMIGKGPTEKQQEWLNAFANIKLVLSMVWRPSDLKVIEESLDRILT